MEWNLTATAAAATVLALAVARFLHVWTGRDCSPEKIAFSVHVHNVLAREYTKYNVKHHRNDREGVEAMWQSRRRYNMSTDSILEEAADAVLLQECPATYFEKERNPRASALLENYDLHPCFGPGGSPGTVVLLKKQGALRKAGRLIRVGGTDETGGTSKSACCVPVTVPCTDLSYREEAGVLWVVSVHFTWNGAADKRLRHIRLIGDALNSVSPRPSGILIGGDFNALPEDLPALEAAEGGVFESFGLRRLRLQSGVNTGLNANFSHAVCIDHLYASPIFSLLGVPRVEKDPTSPYSIEGDPDRPAKIIGSSDHVWINAKLREL